MLSTRFLLFQENNIANMLQKIGSNTYVYPRDVSYSQLQRGKPDGLEEVTGLWGVLHTRTDPSISLILRK